MSKQVNTLREQLDTIISQFPGHHNRIDDYRVFDQLEELITKREESAELRGLAKCLDDLWENSYYAMSKDAAKRIEKEMVYYFGEDWTTTMYAHISTDGISNPSYRHNGVKRLSELASLKGDK